MSDRDRNDKESCEHWKNAESGDCVFVRWGSLKSLGDEWLAGAEVAGVRDNGLLLYRPGGDRGETPLRDGELKRLRRVVVDLCASMMACSGLIVEKGVCSQEEFVACRESSSTVLKAALADLLGGDA